MKRNLLTFLGGALFGAELAISGITDLLKVTTFLDIFEFWDPTLAFVMGGALMVTTPCFRLLRSPRSLPRDSGNPVSKPLIIGAVLFGIGWGLGGFCPGPAIANLGVLRTEALAFVPSMAVKMILVQRLYKLYT